MPLRENSYLHQLHDLLNMVNEARIADAVKSCTRIGCEADVMREALAYIEAAVKNPNTSDAELRNYLRLFSMDKVLERADYLTQEGLSAVDLPT